MFVPFIYNLFYVSRLVGDLHAFDRSMAERSSFVSGAPVVGGRGQWQPPRPKQTFQGNGPIIVPVEAHPQPPQSLHLDFRNDDSRSNMQHHGYQQVQHQLPPHLQGQLQHQFHQGYRGESLASGSPSTPSDFQNSSSIQQPLSTSSGFQSRVSSRLDSPVTPTADLCESKEYTAFGGEWWRITAGQRLF